jgi:hypothetical protein
VHDGIGTEREGQLQVRRGERVVDDNDRVAVVRDPRDRFDVDDGQHRVGRRLDPHDARLVPPLPVDRVEVGEVDRRPGQAARLVHARDEPVRAAVGVVRDEHMVARVQPPQQGVLRRQPAREREAVARLLERREALLERAAGGIAAAGVLEAVVLAHRPLRERRGQRDRRHHRTGRAVGLLAGVDGTGLELVAWAHAAPSSGARSRTERRTSNTDRTSALRRGELARSARSPRGSRRVRIALTPGCGWRGTRARRSG